MAETTSSCGPTGGGPIRGPYAGRVLVSGRAAGRALVLGESISFWGGVDPATGEIVDVRHPRRGERVAGRVLVMPSGRGSSSSSTVLAESVRRGTQPAAILLLEPDPVLVLGAVVAEALYGRALPIVVLAAESFARVVDGAPIVVENNGEIKVEEAEC